MFRILISALTLSFIFTGCLKSSNADTGSCDYDPCAIKAPASEIQQVQDYLTSNGITATQDCSGLFYRIDAAGTGATPTVCSNISVTYEGKLTNGNVFDSRSTPISFELSRVIRGWKNGLPLIKSGGRIYLYVPPTLGYGNNAQGSSIPANSILIFRIELISVQ